MDNETFAPETHEQENAPVEPETEASAIEAQLPPVMPAVPKPTPPVVDVPLIAKTKDEAIDKDAFAKKYGVGFSHARYIRVQLDAIKTDNEASVEAFLNEFAPTDEVRAQMKAELGL